jgi:hypothetical protein
MFLEIPASLFKANPPKNEIFTPLIGVPATNIVIFIAYIEVAATGNEAPHTCIVIYATYNEIPQTISGNKQTNICIALLLHA